MRQPLRLSTDAFLQHCTLNLQHSSSVVAPALGEMVKGAPMPSDATKLELQLGNAGSRDELVSA